MPLDSTFKDRYVMLQFAACHLGVYLCRGDVRVTENLAHGLNRHTIFKGQDCKRVPIYVVRDSLLDTTHCSHFLDALVDGVKPADIEQVAVLSQWLISLYNLHRNIHQLDLKRYACLLTLGNYPRIQAIVTDELLGKLIHCYVAALVLKLDELGNVLSCHKMLAISPNSSVFTHTFGKGCILLVKRL